MRVIKWGIIGAGNISTKFATGFKALENTEIAAIASRDLSKAKQFADRFHIRKAYGSYEELARDPEIDVVYIGTPHTEHRANSALCIREGKAVLCEKPFTVNQKESEYLISLAKEHKVFLMEAMWTKFQPVTKAVKQWIAEGRIGRIKYMNITFGFQTEFNPKSRLFDPDLAGGALLDVGVYPISYAIHMAGTLPKKVVSNAFIGSTGVDEIDTISMLFPDGSIADLSCAVSANTGNDAMIVGEKGKIFIPKFWSAQSAEVFDAEGRKVDEISKIFASNGYEYEAEAVNECLREGKQENDRIPLQDTQDIIGIMDGIRKEWGLTYPCENNRIS